MPRPQDIADDIRARTVQGLRFGTRFARQHPVACGLALGGSLLLVVLAAWLSWQKPPAVGPLGEDRVRLFRVPHKFGDADLYPGRFGPARPLNLAAFRHQGRIERINGRLRFGVEPGLILDEDDDTYLWLTPEPADGEIRSVWSAVVGREVAQKTDVRLSEEGTLEIVSDHGEVLEELSHRSGLLEQLQMESRSDKAIRSLRLRRGPPTSSLSITLSVLGREAARVTDLEIVVHEESAQALSSGVRVLGSPLSPTEGFQLLAHSREEAATNRMKLTLPQPVCCRFLRFDFDGELADGVGIAELRVHGRPCKGSHPYNLTSPRFSPLVSVTYDSPAKREPAPAVVSGLLTGESGDCEDLVWRSNGAYPPPMNLAIRFPCRTALVQSIMLDTQIWPTPADAAPYLVEVWSTEDDGGEDFEKIAELRVPAHPGAHLFALAKKDEGHLARRLRLRIVSNQGNEVRTALRELAVFGYYQNGPLPKTIDFTDAPTPVLATVAAPGGQRFRLAPGGELRVVLQADASLANKPAQLKITADRADQWRVYLRGSGELGQLDEMILAPGDDGARVVNLSFHVLATPPSLELVLTAPEGSSPTECEIAAAPLSAESGLVELEPNNGLDRPQRLGPPLGDEEADRHVTGTLLSDRDTDVYSFTANSVTGRYTFILSEMRDADVRFAVLGPDDDRNLGVLRGRPKPETCLTIDDSPRVGREVYSGWQPPGRGEYLIIVGMKPGGRPGGYTLRLRYRPEPRASRRASDGAQTRLRFPLGQGVQGDWFPSAVSQGV